MTDIMKEIRTQQDINNTSTDSRKVEGYAVVYNSLSGDLGGFFEIIEEGAIDDDVINRSDILCLLDHRKERGVLARSTNGKGSLSLTLDSHGLKYSFEAPHTALGDEILEGLRRGDISKCSFAFTVEKDRWEKQEDGTVIRHIDKIKQLYDVSLVYSPAYEDTEVKADTRGLKELQEKENNSDLNNSKMDDKKELIAKLQDMIALLQEDEKPTEEKPKEEDVENNACNPDNKEEKSEEEDKQTEESTTDENAKEEVVEDVKDDTENETRNNKNININKMSKKFSLIQTINDVVNNRNINDTAKAVIAEGRSAMAKSGLSANGQIILPIEARAEGDETTVTPNGVMATEATFGRENVPTDTLDILEPLRANMILGQAGATFLTGLVGDVQIPVYDGSNVTWEGEISPAKDGAGKWSAVKLQPKRLTAFVDVSKQFLLQDSNDANAMLERDIINAISEKLEQTVFGDSEGSATEPAGLFNGVTAMTTAVKYGDIIDAEAALEDKNVNDFVYVLSPKAKAAFRGTSKDAGSGRFLMENGEIEGVKAYVSSAVKTKGFVIGDFKDYVVGSWGSIDLTVDPYTKAADGQVRLVVNAYFDAKPRRKDAFVAKILK